MHLTEPEKRLVTRLLQLPAAEREAMLDQACLADAALAGRRAVLVAALTPPSAPPVLRPADEAVAILEAALEPLAEDTPGAPIGPYKLLEKIGEGGFGTVWMAEQTAPVRRRVALKIIKLGMDTEEVIARFEAERQALALMNHPNIAQVFDAGATDSGRPYFVMELVRGVAITRYCDENGLSAPARLKLFITVCQAVQHAHQKGVIHRDLKPSNILVTLHDGMPVPKIIDFGIAKATGRQLTDRTLFTQFHAFLGTPAYTSPEQMEMSGLDVDTRSDIYSLGVLLYELLTGRPPFDPDALARSGLEAMRRTIRESDPPRPSARLATLSDVERTTVAQRRGTDATRLSFLLRGDLDWIVMRCLEKDRARRYETANGLAIDVQRHLASEPVAARPPGRLYRLRKFVRRHRVGVAAGTAITLSLVGGLIASSVLLVRERTAHMRALASERAEATLRRQADAARAAETLRVSRTARDMAGRFLAEGRSAEGLAYLVHAARKNPVDATLAPYLASALASRNFLLPVSAPAKFPARIAHLHYLDSGRKLAVYCDDGTIGFIDVATGGETRVKLPAGLIAPGVVFTDKVTVVCGEDDTVRTLDPETGRVLREFNFGLKITRISVKNDDAPVIIAMLENRSVVVAETATGRIRTMPFTLVPPWVAFLSPDGRWMVRGKNRQREAQLCDLLTGECRAIPMSGEFKAVQFNADATRLAVIASRPPSPEITLQFRSVPELVEQFPPQLLPFTNPTADFAVTFSPDGRRFSIASQQNQQWFATATGKPVGPFLTTGFLHLVRRSDAENSGRSVDFLQTSFRSAAFVSSAGRPGTITTGSPDVRRELAVRDIETGEIRLPPLKHAQGVDNVLLSRDGSTALSRSGDGFLMLWDVRTGRLLAEPGWQQPSKDGNFALSPRGDEIALGGADGVIQRLRAGRGAAHPLMLPRSTPVMPAPFLPQAPSRVLWPKSDRAAVLDATSGAWLGSSAFPEPIRGITAGGRGIAIRRDMKYMIVQPEAGGWQAWEIETARIKRIVPLEDAPADDGRICFSATGDRAALISYGQLDKVRLWDLATGRSVGGTLSHVAGVVPGHNRAASFSPDGRRLAVGSIRGTVRVWDAATGAVVADWQCGRDAAMQWVEFDARGIRMVTVNSRNEAQLWDAATGASTGATFTDVSGATFSPSGEQLLTWGEGIARVWDVDTGTALSEPMVHPGVAIRWAAWSADGRRIVTGAQDSTARIWDARTGLPISEPMPHVTRVVGCEFSPDGRFVRTEQAGNQDTFTMFSLWSVPPDAGDAPPPEWLLRLATICAGKRIDDSGKCVDAPVATARLDELRRELAALPDDAPFVQWGRWILDNRPDRPIAPGFTITPAEADQLAANLNAAAP